MHDEDMGEEQEIHHGMRSQRREALLRLILGSVYHRIQVKELHHYGNWWAGRP